MFCLNKVNEDSKSQNKRKSNGKSYASTIKGSPLLNKHEMDKRQTFKEIVNGFPFAQKQKKLVESIRTNSNIVTDKDIENYQTAKLMYAREKPLMKIKPDKTKHLRQVQSQDRGTKQLKKGESIDPMESEMTNDKTLK